MQERTLDNLILENEDYIFEGNLTINGKVSIKNGSLIVSGNLILDDDLQIEGGDISCGSIDSRDISITDGDIYVNTDAYFGAIESDGNIEIGGTNGSASINCLNFFVVKGNDSTFINAIEDVYILGDNDSYDINARDVLISGNCNFNDYGLTAKSFVCEGNIENCSSMAVG